MDSPRQAGERPATLMRVAVGSFAAGIVALLVVLGLFLLGYTDLPWWLSVGAILLTSAGFFFGLFGLLREARSPR